jgi:hypothetical protein
VERTAPHASIDETAMSNLDPIPYSDAQLRAILQRVNTIAMVGARQLTDEQRQAAGAGPDVIRLSIGLESAEDQIRDLDEALSA